jgi:H3 lysine-79-specific histone-lysine N-methyltransferase
LKYVTSPEQAYVTSPEQYLGEVSMASVTALLKVLEIQQKDVFMDVGAGIGNIIAQVALQSLAHQVLGIEIRESAVLVAKQILADTAIRYPQLLKITMLDGDIRASETIAHDIVLSCTILYSFNKVFDHTSNMAIEALSCQLSRLRLVAVANKFCPRHDLRQTCRNQFCAKWKLREQVEVNVTYSSKPVLFCIYERQ